MISINGLDYLKLTSELQADVIPGGVIYLIIEGDIIVWKKASKVFDLDVFKVGERIQSNGVSAKALRENKKIVEDVPRSIYGTRLRTIAEPLVNDEGETVGVFFMAIPILHPIAKAFNDFAPILTEMFPEGSVFYMTDLHKYIRKQSSKKFDTQSIVVGEMITEETVASKVIKSKQPISVEDASRMGMPSLISNYPLFDEENEVVGTFGIVIPKEVAVKLRDMSTNLESGLSGISAAIEELAASASEIHANELDLNKEIKGIITLSEEINEISAFIKEIADETKMLGLNAAIEAARAGDAGRGFGVVAEEIRKLSEQSKSTVPKIKKLTDDIKTKVESASEMSQGSLSSSQEQAAASEQITASIQEITSTSEELNSIAKML